MASITVVSHIAERLRGLDADLRQILRETIQELLAEHVQGSKGRFRKGSYQRIGPRGGLRPVPPPVASQLTSRSDEGGYVGHIAFRMLSDLAGVSEIRTGMVGNDPMIYGPALARRGGIAWNPMGSEWEAKTVRNARNKLQDAVRRVLGESNLAIGTNEEGGMGSFNYGTETGFSGESFFGGMQGF